MSIEHIVLPYNKYGDKNEVSTHKGFERRQWLTQTQIGEKLNIPQRTYAYYESGERTIPPEILIALADFYNTSVDYILGRTDKR